MTNFNETIGVPPRFHHYQRGGWHLLYDPDNVSWVRLNNDGLKILEMLKEHKTIDNVSQHLSRQYTEQAPEENRKIIAGFVDNLVSVGFLMHGPYKQRKFKHFYQAAPSEIYLMMTYKCNLKCKYCYNFNDRACFNSQPQEESAPPLTLDEYNQIVSDAKEMGVKKFVFTGGEALLNPITVPLSRSIRSMEMETELITNGTLIDDPLAEKLSNSFDVVTVSLDSLNPDSHEKMRGKNTFARTLKAIKRLKSHGAKVRVNSVITCVNVKEMLKTWRAVYEELNCDFYTPAPFTPDTDDEAVNSQFLPDIDELLAEQVKVRDFFKDKPGIAIKPAQFRFSCGIANGEMSISSDGFVFPCHTLHKPELECGNLREMPLPEIVATSPLIKKLREFNVNDIPYCSKCDFKYLCGGGCLAMNYNVHKDFYQKNDFYCDYLKQEQIERLWTSTMLNVSAVAAKQELEKEVEYHEKRSA